MLDIMHLKKERLLFLILAYTHTRTRTLARTRANTFRNFELKPPGDTRNETPVVTCIYQHKIAFFQKATRLNNTECHIMTTI